MAQQNTTEKYLQAGVRAAQSGNKARARELLEAALKRDQNLELAWIWLASVVDSQRERQICIQKVLQINPNNRVAREALNNMVGILGDSAEIDYNLMSRAARQKLSGDDSTASLRSSSAGAGDSGGGSGGGIPRGAIFAALGIIAIVLAIALVWLSLPTINSILNPTPTPEPTRVIPTITPTWTPSPTAQGGGVSGALVERATFTPAPTITSLPTVTPSITPMPTATLPAVNTYDLIFTVNEGSSSSLYYFDVETNESRLLGTNVGEFDYNEQLDRLAFLREGRGDGDVTTTQVFVGSPDNPNAADAITRLGEGLTATGVSISPDGLNIVYSVNNNSTRDDDLFVYDTRTGLSRNITDTADSDIDPYWAAADIIVFASDRETPGFYDIYQINLATNQVERIIDRRGSNVKPSVSPDGDTILYVNELGNDRKIIRANADGSGASDVTGVGDVLEDSPAWTYDGRYFLFTSTDVDLNVQLFIQSEFSDRLQTIPTGNVGILTVRAVRPR